MKLAIAPMTMVVTMALSIVFSSAARAAELTVALTTRASGGSIAVAVYRDADAFRRGQGPVATRSVPRTGAVTSVTFSGLAPGRYAVAAFHDTDANGALTLWPIGLPREAYGFSNDARGRFGPPPFASAAFEIPAGGARQAFTLR